MCAERMAIALIRRFQNLEMNSLLGSTEKGIRKSRGENKTFLEKMKFSDLKNYFFLLS